MTTAYSSEPIDSETRMLMRRHSASVRLLKTTPRDSCPSTALRKSWNNSWLTTWLIIAYRRNSIWEYLGSSSSESGALAKGGDDRVKLDFGLSSAQLSEDAKKAWPYDFALVYSVTLSKDGVQTMLHVQNKGDKPFEFQMLLHTYFKIDVSFSSLRVGVPRLSSTPQDITRTTINGLGSTSYIDKVLNATEHQQTTPTLSISGEVDRVYKSIKQDTTSILHDGKPRFDVQRDNLEDTVTWNPWIEKAKSMGDFEPNDGYKHMVCVEVGAVNGWQKLESGDVFEGGQIIKSHL